MNTVGLLQRIVLKFIHMTARARTQWIFFLTHRIVYACVCVGGGSVHVVCLHVCVCVCVCVVRPCILDQPYISTQPTACFCSFVNHIFKHQIIQVTSHISGNNV